MTTTGFRPSHVVPEGGLDTWPAPDPSAGRGPPLPARLPVQVVGRLGDWTEAVCSNGWSAWVDGRRLEPLAPPVVSEAVGWDAPLGPPNGAAAPAGEAGGEGGLLGRIPLSLALVGGLLVAVSSALDWVSAAGVGAHAFDFPFRYLYESPVEADSGFKLGMVVLALGIVGMVAAVRPGLGALRRGCGIGALVVATLFAVQTQRSVGDPEAGRILSLLGVGVYVAVTGGLLLLLSGGRRRSP